MSEWDNLQAYINRRAWNTEVFEDAARRLFPEWLAERDRERDAKREEQAWRRGFAAYRDVQREEVWFQDNERTVLCQKCGSPVVFIVRGAPEPKR